MSNPQTFNWTVKENPGPIVRKLTEAPAAFEALAPVVRAKPRVGEPIRFNVSVRTEPTGLQGKRAVILSPGPGWSDFEIRCDEGTLLGGQDSAPSPLGYFCAGVAFCLMTHVTEYIARVKLEVDQLAIELRGHFITTPGHAHTASTPPNGCERLEVHVLINSQESPERILGLMNASQAACMALQTVANAVPTSAALILNGVPLGSN